MLVSAVVPLLSSIIGGVLVLAGQIVTRRHEDRRLWLTRLYEAAGDLATSYLQEAAQVNDSRRSKKQKYEVDTKTYVIDRQKALGRFRTLPWAHNLEAQRTAMGRAIEQLWMKWDSSDDDFTRAYDEVWASVAAFTSAVGALLIHPPHTRPWRQLRRSITQ